MDVYDLSTEFRMKGLQYLCFVFVVVYRCDLGRLPKTHVTGIRRILGIQQQSYVCDDDIPERGHSTSIETPIIRLRWSSHKVKKKDDTVLK